MLAATSSRAVAVPAFCAVCSRWTSSKGGLLSRDVEARVSHLSGTNVTAHDVGMGGVQSQAASSFTQAHAYGIPEVSPMPHEHNQVCLIGRLGTDITLQQLPTGNIKGRVRLGFRHTEKSNAADSATSWVTLIFWGRMAEVASSSLFKGTRVRVIGRLKLEEWNDKQTGQPRSQLVVLVDDVARIARPGFSSPTGQTLIANRYHDSSAAPLSAQDMYERRWRSVFEEPHLWYCYIEDKASRNHPDFVRKDDRDDALWLDNRNTPSWVVERLQSMASESWAAQGGAGSTAPGTAATDAMGPSSNPF